MGKYSKEIVDKIYELLATGDHSIKDVCKQVGISKETYFTWKNEKPDFSDLIKDAEAERLSQFKNMARSGLAKLLDVYEYDEVATESIPFKGEWVEKTKVTRKFVMPNATAVIFTLTNTDSSNFQHKKEIKHSGLGKITVDIPEDDD